MPVLPDECIDYIHSLSKFGKKAGLDNIVSMLERLGNPQKKLKFIHVAGTNGKGSVSNMIENILVSHGLKVGYYTSPYIEEFNERICINNVPIPTRELCRYVNIVKDAMQNLTPIEFEFITAIAMCYFAQESCDVVVLEVGLGGRFDATNVIDTPVLNVITPIGLDHTAILGDTVEKIAFEKAGTIKYKSDVVVSPVMDKKCIEVIKKRCVETSSQLTVASDDWTDVSYSLEKTEFTYKGYNVCLPLLGEYQVSNAALAIEAAVILKKKLGITDDDILNGIASSFWKCRFEVCGKNPYTVLDGAHNSHGIKALMKSVELYFPEIRKVFLFSMLNEKDYKESIDLIKTIEADIVVTSVPSLRQTSVDEIYDAVREHFENAVFEPEPLKAFERARVLAGKNGAVFVFGSLYLAGELRRFAIV